MPPQRRRCELMLRGIVWIRQRGGQCVEKVSVSSSMSSKSVSFESDKKKRKLFLFFPPVNAISVLCEPPIDCLEHPVNINYMFAESDGK